jgi:hypothetical protein
MNSDPYRAPAARVSDPFGGEFRWTPALVGGAAGMGLVYAFWAIVSPMFQHWYAANGVSVANVYSTMMQSPAYNAIGHAVKILGVTVGGIAAAQLAGTRPLAHALASAVVAYIVLAGNYLGVFTPPFPLWSQSLSVLIPVPCALLGGWLYAVRHTRL